MAGSCQDGAPANREGQNQHEGGGADTDECVLLFYSVKKRLPVSAEDVLNSGAGHYGEINIEILNKQQRNR